MRSAIGLLAISVAGCTTMAADKPVAGETPSYECKSDGPDAFVGRDPTAEIGSEILTKSGAKALRWLRPGQIVTMEFRFDRVNVHLGADNKIVRVTCG